MMGTFRCMMVGLFVVACRSGGGEPGEPTADDRDGDGLTNAEEAALGSNPDAADTDRDGWDDLIEVDNYTDPLNGFDHPYTGGWEIDACRNDLRGTGGARGDVALPFSLMDQHGDPVRLHDFCDRVVLIASAAGWCQPCQQEAPFLQRMFEEYKDDGLMVITLLGEDASSQTPSLDVLQDWADEFELTHPVLQDTSFSATAIFTGPNGALPANHLLARGAVVEFTSVMEVDEEMITSYLD
ncbi:MAG: redoxin domain-containing protein [Myxococcota bacterium]